MRGFEPSASASRTQRSSQTEPHGEAARRAEPEAKLKAKRRHPHPSERLAERRENRRGERSEARENAKPKSLGASLLAAEALVSQAIFPKSRQKNGRGGEACPETVSTLEKVSDYRKLLIALFGSEIVSK